MYEKELMATRSGLENRMANNVLSEVLDNQNNNEYIPEAN